MSKIESLDEKRMQEIALMIFMSLSLHEASSMSAEELEFSEEHFDTWDNRNSAARMSEKLGITVEEATRFLATIHFRAINIVKENLAKSEA